MLTMTTKHLKTTADTRLPIITADTRLHKIMADTKLPKITVVTRLPTMLTTYRVTRLPKQLPKKLPRLSLKLLWKNSLQCNKHPTLPRITVFGHRTTVLIIRHSRALSWMIKSTFGLSPTWTPTAVAARNSPKFIRR